MIGGACGASMDLLLDVCWSFWDVDLMSGAFVDLATGACLCI